MPKNVRRKARQADDDYDEDEPLEPSLEQAADEALDISEAIGNARRRRNHKMGIGRRKELAFEMFARRLTNAEVAREVGVHPDTVTRYRKEYDDHLSRQAKDNPNLLRDVVGNTIRALDEFDRLIKEAWTQYEDSRTSQAKAQFLKLALAGESERVKLLGVMGVKHDVMVYVNSIKEVQEKLMGFFQDEGWCETDRARIEAFLIDTFSDQLANISTPADMAT